MSVTGRIRARRLLRWACEPGILRIAVVAQLSLLTACGHEDDYELAWTRALVARGRPEQALEHYERLAPRLQESVRARSAALEAHIERAGFKPLAMVTALRGTLQFLPLVYRGGDVSTERLAAVREVLARAEELTREGDPGSVLLLGGGTRLICALIVTRDDPVVGIPSVLSALEYVAAGRDLGVAVVINSAQAVLDRIDAAGGDPEAALLAWLEASADE